MFTIIKTLNNYLILTNTIKTEELKYTQIQEQIAYTQKFMEPYLLSHFAPYFLGHENGRYLPGEVVITFGDGAVTPSESPGTGGSQTGATQTPGQAVFLYRPASEEWQSLIQFKRRLLQKKLFF